jgi:hypothetical protein
LIKYYVQNISEGDCVKHKLTEITAAAIDNSSNQSWARTGPFPGGTSFVVANQQERKGCIVRRRSWPLLLRAVKSKKL